MKPNLENEKDWKIFENGNTLGNKGSEGGTIISDFENVNGARITVERECRNIPFAITFGIYGTMFHTHYEGDDVSANEYLGRMIQKINDFFELYKADEEHRNSTWHNSFNILMSELTD